MSHASTSTRTHKHAALTEQLRLRMASGVWHPGSRLPTVLALKEEFGVSISTLDKAIGALEREGLVRRVPGSGVFVAVPEVTRTPVIGLWGGQWDANSPYYAPLMGSIQATAHAHGAQLLVLAAQSGPEATLARNTLTGLIAIGPGSDPATPPEMPDIPTVALLRGAPGAQSVCADERAGLRGAVRQLRAMGHERIAYLTLDSPDESGFWARERLAGYDEAIAALGLPRLVRTNPHHGAWPGFVNFGREAMRLWLQDGFKDVKATVLLVYNDDAAVGALDALHAAGMSVPEDLSLVGFDGSLVCEYVRPPLATIALPMAEMGRKAVELLLETSLPGAVPSAQHGAPAQVTLNATLVRRASLRVLP